MQAQWKIGQDRKGKEMYRLRSRQADRWMKPPERPGQKTDACSLFSLPYLAVCSPDSAFKAPAGGDTLSPAPWLPHTPPVYLPSAEITLSTPPSYAARLDSILRPIRCVSGWECVIKGTFVLVCLFISVMGASFPVLPLSSARVWHLAWMAFYSFWSLRAL